MKYHHLYKNVKQPIFDSHFHIIDYQFPLVSNQGYAPPEFTCDDYLEIARPLNIVGGTVVSGSSQKFDQTFLMAALNRLGPNFVGVTQLPVDITEKEIHQLNLKGVRAIRFNLKRCGMIDPHDIKLLAKKVFAVAGWHSEFYIDPKDLIDLYPLLSSLPAISIDHLGLGKAGFPYLLKLVEQGAKVKASGFGRVDFHIASALQEIYLTDENALMFGTDLPSTRAARPFQKSDIELLTSALPEEAETKILYGNAVKFYRVSIPD
ncbi:MAG: amidohydrolase family protein [Proteobacteria bacterium]|nr:amidohydrolase family protein [Pseudomonadota bacterium]